MPIERPITPFKASSEIAEPDVVPPMPSSNPPGAVSAMNRLSTAAQQTSPRKTSSSNLPLTNPSRLPRGRQPIGQPAVVGSLLSPPTTPSSHPQGASHSRVASGSSSSSGSSQSSGIPSPAFGVSPRQHTPVLAPSQNHALRAVRIASPAFTGGLQSAIPSITPARRQSVPTCSPGDSLRGEQERSDRSISDTQSDPMSLKSPSTASITVPHMDSHYVFAHLCEPCTVGALTHRLYPCGHRVITRAVVDCARNCHLPPTNMLRPNGEFANARNLDRPFSCPECVDSIVQSFLNANHGLGLCERKIERLFGRVDEDYLPDLRKSAEVMREAMLEMGERCEMISGEPEQGVFP